MLFTHDTEASLDFVVDLVNADDLSSADQLDRLLDQHSYSGRRDGDAAELTAVSRSRDRLRRCWAADDVQALVDEVNAMLAEARALPQVVDHDDLGWHVHATTPDAPLARRIEVEAALALADVVRGGAVDRLRRCDAEGCAGVLFDRSRNGSKRFCSVRCGNRTSATAYRARRSADGS